VAAVPLVPAFDRAKVGEDSIACGHDVPTMLAKGSRHSKDRDLVGIDHAQRVFAVWDMRMQLRDQHSKHSGSRLRSKVSTGRDSWSPC
jgi:hypothetical protein